MLTEGLKWRMLQCRMAGVEIRRQAAVASRRDVGFRRAAILVLPVVGLAFGTLGCAFWSGFMFCVMRNY